MAKFPKLATSRFGAPPPPEETPGNLTAPEVAPAAPTTLPAAVAAARRSRQKTGRTVLFSTRVSEQFDADFRATAERDNLLLTRLLELALAAYKREKQM